MWFFGLVFVATLLVIDILARVLPRRTIALPARYIGRLPPGATAISGTGDKLLRQAIVLVAQALETNELYDQSESAARAWIVQVQDTALSVDAAQLLAKAGALLLQIEAEDRLIERLSSSRKQQISTWLDNYLNRKG